MALKTHNIPIEKIGIHRELESGDDVTELAQSIRGEGQARSVIVDKYLNLIDGLRRIRALQLLGQDNVSAIVAETLEDVDYTYVRTRKHGTLAKELTYRRMYEFFESTRDLQRERRNRLSQKPGAAGHMQARPYITQTLGVASESTLATANLMYKAFTNNDDPSIADALAEIRAKLESGEETLYGCRGLLNKVKEPGGDFTGSIVTANDQRAAISTALAQLSGTNKAINQLGELHEGINQHELVAYIKALSAEKRALTITINKLRKRVKV